MTERKEVTKVEIQPVTFKKQGEDLKIIGDRLRFTKLIMGWIQNEVTTRPPPKS